MSGQEAERDPRRPAGRLKKRADYLAARAGERRKGPFFLLEVFDRQDAAPPRVGYTVTKRQGNAVERNRMRRRLKEAVRLEAQFAMKPGHDYVVVARRDALDAAFSRLTSALKDRIESPQRSPRRSATSERTPRSSADKAKLAVEPPPRSSRPNDGRPKKSRPSGIRDGQ